MALETLPAELKIHILKSMPDVETLHDLIRVSAAYRSTYRLSQRSILDRLVREHYGAVGLEEPIMAIRSAGLHAEDSANKQRILEVLDRQRVSDSVPSKLNPSDSIDLLHLHQKFQTILNSLCSHARRPSQAEPLPQQQNAPLQLSSTEKARILRALCRLQTYCNVFGAREWIEPADDICRSSTSPCKRTSSTWYKNFTIHEMWRLCFGSLAPWEVEEFGSVWVLVRNEYKRMFDEIRQEFPRTDSRWRSLRPASLPADPWELYPSSSDDANDYDIYLNHLVLLGPTFLHKVLSQNSREDRWRLLACNAISSKSSFMDTVRVVRDPSPRLWSVERFTSDDTLQGLRAMPAIDQPNLGWKQHWHGRDVTGSEIFAFRSAVGESGDAQVRNFGHCAGWEWGYALWDAAS
ncbi:hypothetical protein KXW98_008972 [Aspergillus fumigatus]|jgi:hypothetical protein|uniref:F-box domain-containing protein n=3 Tax=Aspergillus fumigatus TaxID=746128 RepID=Q4WIY6_ASPFU|nr:conserved hypothetical protein [Aspergillus fumigatus Af293]EDP53688.1 conserved hypothetical protein [Aspergillus fumigatus A1163]KAF4267004.1 hypothetical protein CNMCM8714_004197 [Aspergillus fumigatus]KMK62215.1 hypothetical protein Y699_04598 [Aspergillus fumigatus Z5]EAL87119.1 conserved hypothetical protein [Aspergillus fumigatus Af293]KAF4274969.1 hypothetical protein CNMCM8812_003475 [Aspergillus fumigatus]